MTTKSNINSLDRLTRLLAGAIGILLIVLVLTSGTSAFLVGAVSLTLLVTAAVNYCPIYELIGFTSSHQE